MTVAWIRTGFVVTAFSVALAGSAMAEPLELRRVVVSSGGVAYYEFEAEVTGDVGLDLSVPLDQVDDILKSLVVYDNVGRVGAIRLPGRDALDQAFRDLPFDQSDLSSPRALLAALQGASITVTGARQVSGRVLSVHPETIMLLDGLGTTVRHRVSLATADGLRQFILEDAESIAFDDAGLRSEIDMALGAVSAHRSRDRRDIVIDSMGVGDAGTRTVRVGYVTAAPLWKSSYRVTLGAEGEGGGRVQGWAVIENMSGQDWRDVQLTFVSGNPVTFRQALYTAYYVDRPEIPVEVVGRILPPADRGDVDADMSLAQGLFDARKEAVRGRAQSDPMMEMDAAGAAPSPVMALAGNADLAAPSIATEVDEATTQVAFRLAEPISLGAGQSLTVPIIDVATPARRIALYRAETHARHPLAAIEITNDTGSGLPPGVLTVYRRGSRGEIDFAGDARLATFPAGEDRLISYALDQKIQIDRDHGTARRLVKASISRGLLRLRSVEQQTTTYRIEAPKAEARSLVIEHPRRRGWDLVAPSVDKARLTESHYRLALELAAGESRAFSVVLERPIVDQIGIADLGHDRMAAFAGSKELGSDVRKAFATLARLRAEVDRWEQSIAALDQERAGIFEDQIRLRENLAGVPRDGDLARRYLDKLNTQEDALERIDTGRTDAEARRRDARDTLADAIADLDI